MDIGYGCLTPKVVLKGLIPGGTYVNLNSICYPISPQILTDLAENENPTLFYSAGLIQLEMLKLR